MADPAGVSIAFTDALDNALAESVIGLFKTRTHKSRGPWRTLDQLELATAEYVDCFNHGNPMSTAMGKRFRNTSSGRSEGRLGAPFPV